MDFPELASAMKQDLWSILVIILLIGPPLILHQGSLIAKSRYKESVVFIAEYIVALNAIMIFFGSMYALHDEPVIFSIPLFSLLLASFIWSNLSFSIKDLAKTVLSWVAIFSVIMLITHHKCDVGSMREALVVWENVFKASVLKIGELIFRLFLLGERGGVEIIPWIELLAIALLPVWSIVNKDKHSFLTIYRNNRAISIFIIEFCVVIFATKWIFHGQEISNLWLVMELFTFVAALMAWQAWNTLSVRTKRIIRPIMNLCLLLLATILICQLIWDVRFFAAASILWRKGVVKLAILAKKKLWVKAVLFSKVWWIKITTFVTTLSWAKARSAGAKVAGQVSKRSVTKAAIAASATQAMANKRFKAFKNDRVVAIKILVGKQKDKLVSKFREAPIEQQLFWCVVGMTIVWFASGSLDLIYPIFPKTIFLQLAKLFRLSTGLLMSLARRLFSGRLIDIVSVMFAKSIFGRLSGPLAHKLYMFRKWKVGRFVVGNNRIMMLIDKKGRAEARRIRQAAIEKAKLKEVLATGKIIFTAPGKALDGAVQIGKFAKDGLLTEGGILDRMTPASVKFPKKV